jgi:hypothetical protein
MARRPGSTAEREAKDRVRDRYDLEVKAVAEFFGYADQIDKLQAKVEVLEAQQGDVVVRLAVEVGPTRAAATVGWPVNRVREAVANRPDESSASANVGGHV